MKHLFFLSLILTAGSYVHAQQCIEVDRFFTSGFHYLTNKQVNGFQFEIGSTGSESNTSYYAVVTSFRPKRNAQETKVNYPEMSFGGKFAYRFLRAENVLSVYVTTAAGIDMVNGFYNANSLKLLTIIGGKVALSVEPSYVPFQKAFITQVGVNIILD